MHTTSNKRDGALHSVEQPLSPTIATVLLAVVGPERILSQPLFIIRRLSANISQARLT